MKRARETKAPHSISWSLAGRQQPIEVKREKLAIVQRRRPEANPPPASSRLTIGVQDHEPIGSGPESIRVGADHFTAAASGELLIDSQNRTGPGVGEEPVG
jgi:hypothetical protein